MNVAVPFDTAVTNPFRSTEATFGAFEVQENVTSGTGVPLGSVAEAVASRHGHDHEVALQRMRDSGATITTVEAVLFEWLGTSDRPEFKEVSGIVKS